MSIDMYLGSSDQQASSTQHVLQNHINAYQQLQTALSQFTVNSPSLSGVTYQSAKAYSSQVLTPLLRASILLDEAIIAACRKLPSEYRSSVDSVDLRESDLVDRIARADRIVGRYQELINIEYQRTKPNWSRIQNLQTARSNQQTVKRKLEEKLRKLRAFHQSSPQIFSQIAGLHSAVQQGIRQSQQSWNASTKTFVLPPKSEMKWAEEVNGKWEERDIVNAYSIAMKKSENGEKLTEDDILKIQNYRKLNPHRPLSKNTVEALNEERYNWTDIPETVFSKITDPSEWSWGTLGQALEGLNDIAIKQGKNLGRVYGAKLQPRDALGRFIKDAIKPRSWLSAKFKGMSNNTSKIIGRGAKVLGFGISAVLEGVDYYSKYKNVGRAVSYGAVGGIVALGAGVVAGAIGTTLALPAVGTLALGVAVGAVASVGLKAAYENIKPVRAVIDGAGDLLNKGGKAFSDGVKSIGKAISNPIGSLRGAFGW